MGRGTISGPRQRIEGGREVIRPVDLATMPLYVRAGAVIPMGPVRQYVDEPSDEPTTLVVYPGANGESAWYEDDGKSFDYRHGDSTRIVMAWQDATRRLTVRLAPGSRWRQMGPRRLNVRVAGSTRTVPVTFTGSPVTVRL